MKTRGDRKKRFGCADARTRSRLDQLHFDRLVADGFIAPSGDGTFTLTEAGPAAADVGRYDWELATRAATPSTLENGWPAEKLKKLFDPPSV